MTIIPVSGFPEMAPSLPRLSDNVSMPSSSSSSLVGDLSPGEEPTDSDSESC